MRKMLYWVNILLGLWIAASPFVLGFRNVEYAFYTSLISGLAVAAVAFAGWLAEENVIKFGERSTRAAGRLQAA